MEQNNISFFYLTNREKRPCAIYSANNSIHFLFIKLVCAFNLCIIFYRNTIYIKARKSSENVVFIYL